jgi:hypothetical protein
MTEPNKVQLDRTKYRPVLTGPLAKPSHLWWTAVVGIAVAVSAAMVNSWAGTWITALLPIPFAVMAGIALAGLRPGFWFRYDDKDRT